MDKNMQFKEKSKMHSFLKRNAKKDV